MGQEIGFAIVAPNSQLPTPNIKPMIDSVFVYGTLKRGQCRESCWPVRPLRVMPGWIRGTLYGREDYPALLPGEHRVVGELWVFDAGAMSRVLSVLDEIEGTDGNSADDLYHRHLVEVRNDADELIATAYSYFYHRNPIADGFSVVSAFGGNQSWPVD